jgi:hypothetical protein
MMISFFPLLTGVSSDYYIDHMSEISENVPNFGAVTVDHNADYQDAMVLCNGEYDRHRLAILLLYGNVAPDYYIGNISRERVFPEKGVVTGSSGNLLLSVNDMSVTDYFLSIGLKQNEDGTIAGINSFPLLVDMGDSTQHMARAVFGMTPEGAGICGATIPVGAIVSIGSFDSDEILATTTRTIKTALAAKKYSFLLIYSCIGRFYAQGLEQTAEISRIIDAAADAGVSYLASYAGGEMCPVYGADGSLINRIHNNSVIICAF